MRMNPVPGSSARRSLGENAHRNAAQPNRRERRAVRCEFRELGRRHRVRNDENIAGKVSRHACGREELRERLLGMRRRQGQRRHHRDPRESVGATSADAHCEMLCAEPNHGGCFRGVGLLFSWGV